MIVVIYTTNAGMVRAFSWHWSLCEPTSSFYNRRNMDANVVAHNRKMLLLFNGHVNIEFSGTVNLIMYLYKVRLRFNSASCHALIFGFVMLFHHDGQYIFKGPDKCRYSLINTRDRKGVV